jgi:hypothetical protein
VDCAARCGSSIVTVARGPAAPQPKPARRHSGRQRAFCDWRWPLWLGHGVTGYSPTCGQAGAGRSRRLDRRWCGVRLSYDLLCKLLPEPLQVNLAEIERQPFGLIPARRLRSVSVGVVREITAPTPVSPVPQFLAVRLSDNLKARLDNSPLGPLIDLEVLREPHGSRIKGGVTVESRTIEHACR